jgi:hypothetical protein
MTRRSHHPGATAGLGGIRADRGGLPPPIVVEVGKQVSISRTINTAATEWTWAATGSSQVRLGDGLVNILPVAADGYRWSSHTGRRGR